MLNQFLLMRTEENSEGLLLEATKQYLDKSAYAYDFVLKRLETKGFLKTVTVLKESGETFTATVVDNSKLPDLRFHVMYPALSTNGLAGLLDEKYSCHMNDESVRIHVAL